MKIVISLQELHLLVKRSKETITNKAQEQKGRFLSMLLGTLASSLLPRKATFLSRRAKGKTKNKRGDKVTQASDGVIRTGERQDFK